MQMTVSDHDSFTEVTVTGDVAYADVRSFIGRLDALLEAREILDVLLDLRSVTYMTSRGLGAVVSTYTILSRRGGRLAVVCTSPEVLSSFAVTKLDKILTIVATRDDAVAVLSAPR